MKRLAVGMTLALGFLAIPQAGADDDSDDRATMLSSTITRIIRKCIGEAQFDRL